jgi:hypothetical protein
MDYHLLFCMLSNYRELYVEAEMKKGTSIRSISHVVRTDIDPYIDYCAKAQYLLEEHESDQRRQELVRAKLKAKLEAAITKGIKENHI